MGGGRRVAAAYSVVPVVEGVREGRKLLWIQLRSDVSTEGSKRDALDVIFWILHRMCCPSLSHRLGKLHTVTMCYNSADAWFNVGAS
jgi:hypothetical protein